MDGFTPPKCIVNVGPRRARYFSNTATGLRTIARESRTARPRGTCGALLILPSNMLRHLLALDEVLLAHESEHAEHDVVQGRIGLPVARGVATLAVLAVVVALELHRGNVVD